MKEPSGLLGQTDLTSRDMRKLVTQTTKIVSTREATERLVKIFGSAYAQSNLKHVSDNATQLNT